MLSLPLQLRFDDDYRYRLAGTERVGGYDCYVVRFEPVGGGPVALPRDGLDRSADVRARQGAGGPDALSAPVVSNEEIQTYAPVTSIGNRPVFLFTRPDRAADRADRRAQPARREERRVLATSTSTRTASRARGTRRASSDRIMYRETDRGLRYYVKEGDTRVVSDRSTQSARAMAMGVTIDPSYAFPLPIFGINYLDFAFRGPDSQLGDAVRRRARRRQHPAAEARIARRSTRASTSSRIAVPSSDRVYDAGGEHEQERLLTWPLTTGLNLGWQYTPFQKLSGSYQFRFDGYTRDTTTSDDFVVPASTITNGFGGGWEYRRGGYSAVVNGAWFARAGWRDWGAPGAAARRTLRPSYTKYSASLSRDFYFNVFQKMHLNGAWFGGRDLDRFAKYQFGMFDDTRIHGVPASGVRFDELGDGPRLVLVQHLRPVPARPLPRARLGPRPHLDNTWQPLTGIGAASTCARPGTRYCAPTSARASCRTATAASARRRCRL